ncbi:hypothetical protein ACTOB_004248 [Actinoplanes oblitus]|uniref:Alpha/beta hydrolase n=1 Tax=Actinoplanes oblitus TaxID=3040509 RepID=A0ABY8WRJ7_9ACTN|nr:hypothetical protein [Actinoplanes oblitus]WIN00535.1 hypothetical protein ACTOB_004248 [Actinoplanes oblitus]
MPGALATEERFVTSGPLRLWTERFGDPSRPAAIPGARLHVVPEMGHVRYSPGLPEEVADLIPR